MLKGVEVIRGPHDTIPGTHQVFPDRYLTTHNTLDLLFLDYAPGTGKTISAVIPMTRLLAKVKELSRLALIGGIAGVLPRPYVVGSWATIQAFFHELMKPDFGIVTIEEVTAIEEATETDRITLVRRLKRRIKKLVMLVSYQKFVNHFFVGSLGLPDKSGEAIRKAIADGSVYLNPYVIGELNDSWLIVDEAQNLYSTSGMNSYGVSIEYIRQSPLINNLKTILLSATMINGSPVEIIYLYNILRPKGADEFMISNYITKHHISSSLSIVRIKRDKVESLLKFSEGKFATYSIAQSDDFPETIVEGTLIHAGKMRFQAMKLTRCYSSMKQWTAFVNKVVERTGISPSTNAHNESIPIEDDMDEVDDTGLLDVEPEGDDLIDESPEVSTVELTGVVNPDVEDNKVPLTSEIYIPPRNEWSRLKIEQTAIPTVFTGRFFEVNNLREYGAVPARFIDEILALFRQGKREKIAGYHRRIRRMGILQYIEILRSNHIISTNENPQSDTVCINCGKAKSAHKRSTRHEYIPARYVVLFGDQPRTVRERVIDLWNAPDNVYGEKATVILISSIAELGLMLKNTMHVYMLGLVPHVSKWRQIIGRFARFRSHTDSPPDRRWVKIKTLVYSPPTRLASKGALSPGEILYYVKEQNDIEINTFIKKQRNRSINCMLHGDVSGLRCRYNIPLSRSPNRTTYNIYYAMLEAATIIKGIKYILHNISPIWRARDLYQLIKSNTYPRDPWSTHFMSDESIVEALWFLIDSEFIFILDKRSRESIRLSPANIKRNDIVIIKRPKRLNALLLYSIGRTIAPDITSIFLPIEERVGASPTNIGDVIKQISETRGHKNKMVLIDSIIVFREFLSYMKRDFLTKGPIFDVLKQLDAIVYKDDSKSIQRFIRNRIDDSFESIPIGFILGPYAYTHDKGIWTKIDIPITRIEHINEWEYVGILTPGRSQTPGKWTPRFRIRPRLRSLRDKRMQLAGLGCQSIERSALRKIYSKIVKGSPPKQKAAMCILINKSLMEKQLKMTARTFYSYFELPPTI